MPEEVNAEILEPQTKATEAMAIVTRNVFWGAGAGLLPLPLVELVAITAVEMKLIKELAAHYNTSYHAELARAGVISLVGSLGSVALGKIVATSALRVIPGIGPILAAASVSGAAAAVTYATGKVFISHFDAGGTLLDFNPAKMRDYFQAEFKNGMRQAEMAVALKSAAPKQTTVYA